MYIDYQKLTITSKNVLAVRFFSGSHISSYVDVITLRTAGFTSAAFLTALQLGGMNEDFGGAILDVLLCVLLRVGQAIITHGAVW